MTEIIYAPICHYCEMEYVFNNCNIANRYYNEAPVSGHTATPRCNKFVARVKTIIKERMPALFRYELREKGIFNNPDDEPVFMRAGRLMSYKSGAV